MVNKRISFLPEFMVDDDNITIIRRRIRDITLSTPNAPIPHHHCKTNFYQRVQQRIHNVKKNDAQIRLKFTTITCSIMP